MIGQIAQRRPGVLDAEAQCRAAVGHGFGAHQGRSNAPLADRAVAEVELARQLAHLNRGQWGGEVPADPVLQRHATLPGAPDRDRGLGPKERREDQQPLNVVEVEVREQHVNVLTRPINAQVDIADTGAGVEHDMAAVGKADLHA
jgi:hypothetical protein